MLFNNLFSPFFNTSASAEKSLSVKPVTLVHKVIEPVLNIITKIGSSCTELKGLSRLTELEKKELIDNHSTLNKKVSSPPLGNCQNQIALLGQINADSLIVNTSLENLSSTEAAKAWVGFAKGVKEESVPESVILSLQKYQMMTEDLAKINNNPKKLFQKAQALTSSVYNLKVRETLLIEGGRVKSSIDCPIVYEFTRTSEESFDIHVYLNGKDNDSDKLVRESVSEPGKKEWHKSIISYKNVPLKELFLENNPERLKKDFFQAILETRFLPGNTKGEFITLHLFGHLQAYRQDEELISTTRRAQSDAWSSLKPFLLKHLGREKTKKVLFEIKLNSLIQGYQLNETLLKQDTIQAEQLRIVLKRGAELILKNLASFHASGLKISDSFYLNARATALELIDFIDTQQKNISEERKRASLEVAIPLIEVEELKTKYQNAIDSAKKNVAIPSARNQDINSTRARFITLPDAVDFAKTLDQFVAHYDTKVKVAAIQAAEIEHFVELLPIPSDDLACYWNQIPRYDLLPSLSALNKLLNIYSKAMGSKDYLVSSKEANVSLAIYSITHFLALAQDRIVNGLNTEEGQINEVCLAYYPAYFPGLNSDKDPYLVFTSPEDYERRQEILAYFKSTYDKTKDYDSQALFNFSEGFNYDSSANSYERLYKTSQKDIATYLWALANDPRFADQIEFSQMTKEWEFSGPSAVKLGFISDDLKRGWVLKRLGTSLNKPKDNSTENLFIDKGFDHIPLLANAAMIAYKFISHKKGLRDRHYISSNFRNWNTLFNVPTSFSFVLEKYFYEYSQCLSSGNLFPALTREHNTLLEQKYISRTKSPDTSFQEAEVLNKTKPDKDLSQFNEIKFLTSSCEPSLFPHKLISYYRSKLDLFESLDQQMIFEIALFRSVALESADWPNSYHLKPRASEYLPYQRDRFHPLMNEIQQKGYQEQLELFIKEGLDRYFLRQPNQRPQVIPATMFIRLACRLSKFVDRPLINSLEYIDKMLATPNLNDEEKSLLSIHKILAYSTLDREITPEEVEQAFGAWVFYKNTPPANNQKNILLEKEAETFIHQISQLLSNRPEFQRSVLKTALAQMGIVLPDSFIVSADNEHPHLIKSNGALDDFWNVNILTGEVLCKDGILRRTNAPRGLQDEYFQYICGSINPSYFQSGACYYFSHPQLGTMRAVAKGNYQIEYKLQRQINGQWYQYVHPHIHLQSIPRFLMGNFTHWMNISEMNSDILICEKGSGQIKAKMLMNGTIVDQKTGETYWSLTNQHFFSNFERPEYIHHAVSNGKTRVIFSRFQSQNNQTLTFEEEKNELVYTANRKYVLSSQQRPGLLGAGNGSLILINRETGEEKVIAAFKPLSSHTPLSSKHEMDVKDKFVSYDSLGEFYADQANRFEYVEYDVKNGSLIPHSQEGTLYLVYQYTAQRKYAEAFYWLKQIDFRDNISEKSQTALLRAIGIAGSTDHSPEASAIALHAWVLLRRAGMRREAEGKAFTSLPNISDVRDIYSRFEHQIPEKLLLNTSDRTLVGISDKIEKSQLVYPDIKKFLPASERNIEVIPEIQLPTEKFGHKAHLLENILNGALNITNFADSYLSKYAFESIITQIIETVIEFTYFIPPETVRSDYDEDHLLTHAWTTEFEQSFFTTAYEIARKGTEFERKQLSYKLQLAAEHNNSKPPSWKFLQLALKYPHEAPDLPNPDPKNFMDRIGFVKKCAKLSQEKLRLEEAAEETLSASLKSAQDIPVKREILPNLFSPRAVENISKPLDLLPFSKETIDNHFTQELFNKYLEEKAKPKKLSVDAPQAPHLKNLEEEEKDFFKILEAEFNEFTVDYQKGKEINEERQFYTLSDPAALQKELNSEIKHFNNELAGLESSILELANKHDPSLKKQTLYKEAKIEQELSMKRLADLFLSGDADAFAKANPFLRNKELIEKVAKGITQPDDNVVINYLYNQIGLYMTLSAHRKRLQRAEDLCKKIIPLDAQNLQRDSLVQKLADELKPLKEPVYSIKDYPAFLVYEYLSGLSIRPQQAKFLEKLLKLNSDGNYINRVFQLIMGGGKTSVMAVILLKLAARKGRLSLFVTPASQYASVSHNLRKTLRDSFGIDMEEIEVNRAQIAESPHIAEEILKRLKSAIDAGNFLLIKSETLQTIALEFLDLIYIASKEGQASTDLMNKINTLKDILIIFKEQGDGLFDEIDLLLNVLQEVNFPVGKPSPIAAERIEVIRELFLLLVSEKANISETESVNLKELIKLQANAQNLVSQETWVSKVSRAVAWNLPQTMESLKLKDKLAFRESFYRYITGTMKKECQMVLDEVLSINDANFNDQDHSDFEFLKYVKSLRNAKDPNDQEAAHHIALVKHMMQTILPVTFEKMGKRNYGRGGTHPGEVRPYLAVDTPSENLFGYHWEAVAYHFQTALQCGISKEQMIHISKVYKEQAQNQSDKENIIFDKTVAALEFKSLTGVALHELEYPHKVEEAIKNLHHNIDALLRFEADTAAEYVEYYPERLTSTGQNLVGLLCTVRAMSGTPWNTPCYPRSLAKNFDKSVGTEGQIAEILLSRIASKEDRKKYTHVVHSKDINGILKELFDNHKELIDKHPEKNRVRLLLDSGALFKDYSNLEVAKSLRDYLKMPILFFMRNPLKDEKTPDTLAVLKLNSDKPEIIGGTRLEDIQATGLKVEEYFVFDDDRHTTGTDIPLTPDTIGLMTMDKSMLRRLFFQTVMRERDFFLNQEIEFVIPDYLLDILKKNLPKEFNTTNEDLKNVFASLVLSLKNQAIAKSKHYYRSCKQKIDAVFRDNLMKELLIKEKLTQGYISKQFENYKGNTIAVQQDNPYDQFGALEYPIDSMETLLDYRDRKLKQFPLNHPRRKEIESQIGEIIEEASKSDYRPAKVLGTAKKANSAELGMQVDVMTEVDNDVNEEKEQDIDQDIIQELARYQRIDFGQLRKEKNWTHKEIKDFINVLKDGTVSNETIALNELLNSDTYTYYERNFKDVFSPKLRATTSWALSANKTLPVFHRLQRSLDQILIVKSKSGYQAVALSQKEANQFKAFLNSNQNHSLHKNVWLILSDGSPIEDSLAGNPPIHEAEVKMILVEANAFNGSITYLDHHQEVSEEWLHANKDQHIEIKKHFLKLKVAKNSIQKRLFFRSEVFGGVNTQQNIRKYRWQLAAEEVASWGETEIQKLTSHDLDKLKLLGPDQLNLIKPEQVKLLDRTQIQHLIKPELVAKIPENFAKEMTTEQMPHLAPLQVQWFKDSVSKTQAIPVTYFEHMSDNQIKSLCSIQVMQIETKDQIKKIENLNSSLLAHISSHQIENGLIDENQVHFLSKKEAIGALPVEWLKHVAKSVRIRGLSKTQVERFDSVTHKTYIEELTEPQVKWLVNEPQLLSLKDSQIAWLSDEQITSIVRSEPMVKKLGKKVGALHVDAVQFVSNEQVPYLTTIDQIRKLPENQCIYLEKNQVHLLERQDAKIIQILASDSKKKGYFTTSQLDFIKNLPKAKIQMLKGASKIEVPKKQDSSTSSKVVVPPKEDIKSSSVQQMPSNIALDQAATVDKSWTVTQVVLTTLGIIVATGIMTAAAFAIVGGLWSGAPQFMIVVFHTFQSPLFMPFAAGALGTTLLVGLLVFVIHKVRYPQKVIIIKREAIQKV